MRRGAKQWPNPQGRPAAASRLGRLHSWARSPPFSPLWVPLTPSSQGLLPPAASNHHKFTAQHFQAHSKTAASIIKTQSSVITTNERSNVSGGFSTFSFLVSLPLRLSDDLLTLGVKSIHRPRGFGCSQPLPVPISALPYVGGNAGLPFHGVQPSSLLRPTLPSSDTSCCCSFVSDSLCACLL